MKKPKIARSYRIDSATDATIKRLSELWECSEAAVIEELVSKADAFKGAIEALPVPLPNKRIAGLVAESKRELAKPVAVDQLAGHLAKRVNSIHADILTELRGNLAEQRGERAPLLRPNGKV